jgi:hypothetical protein
MGWINPYLRGEAVPRKLHSGVACASQVIGDENTFEGQLAIHDETLAEPCLLSTLHGRAFGLDVTDGSSNSGPS